MSQGLGMRKCEWGSLTWDCEGIKVGGEKYRFNLGASHPNVLK